MGTFARQQSLSKFNRLLNKLDTRWITANHFMTEMLGDKWAIICVFSITTSFRTIKLNTAVFSNHHYTFRFVSVALICQNLEWQLEFFLLSGSGKSKKLIRLYRLVQYRWFQDRMRILVVVALTLQVQICAWDGTYLFVFLLLHPRQLHPHLRDRHGLEAFLHFFKETFSDWLVSKIFIQSPYK